MKKPFIFLVLVIVVLFGIPPCAYSSALAGELVAWGYSGYGECDVPAGNDFVAIAGGLFQSCP